MAKRIFVDVYLLITATRTIQLGQGTIATVQMRSKIPWTGVTDFAFDAPEGWEWEVQLPKPNYASDIKVSLYFAQPKLTCVVQYQLDRNISGLPANFIVR